MRLREILEKRFSEKDLRHVKGSFDMIGDVAIIEVPDEINHREKDIVDAILEMHPRIKTIYKKEGGRDGTYRLRDFELIHGDEVETEHREHGYRLRMDVRKVYFSPREGTERQRIAKQVKAKETVMVMFAGAGPYAIAIAKKNPKVRKIYSLEVNPDAYKYMVENVRINKLGHKIVPLLGDCGTECIPYFGKCDRILMPLPKGAFEYLKLASKCLKKKGGIIHYYFWSAEQGLDDVKDIVKVDMESVGRKIRSMKAQKVSEYRPKILKFCLDMRVE